MKIYRVVNGTVEIDEATEKEIERAENERKERDKQNERENRAPISQNAIDSNTYFTIDGSTYKSTTFIPAGDTIIPGTNCIKTNLAEALNALNA